MLRAWRNFRTLVVLLIPALAGADERPFVRGDLDGSPGVSLNDAVAFLGHLYQGAGPLACDDAADANDSEVLDISDPIYTLTYLFQGGPRPPPPGPEDCGRDPSTSDDELPSCRYRSSCGLSVKSF